MAVPSLASTGVRSSTSGVATLTPALPASLVLNNLMIAFIQVQAAAKTIAVGGGWTIGDFDSTTMSTAWAWRLVDGTQAAPVFTWTGTAACEAQVFQYTGNLTTGIFGATNKAHGTGTIITAATLTSTADNSLANCMLACSSNQTIPAPSSYVCTQDATGNGSNCVGNGVAFKSGSTIDGVSTIITSANWASYLIEIKGSGSAPAGEPQARASQTVQQNLISSAGRATQVSASQTVMEVLVTATAPVKFAIVSQTVVQVLVSSSVYVPPTSGGAAILIPGL